MPKRKTREDPDAVTEASPPKRVTRASARPNNSGLVASSTRSTSNSTKKVIQQNGKRFQADAQLDPPVQSARPSRTRKTQSAARPSPLKKTDASIPSTRDGKQNSNPITSPHKQEEPGNSDDADELNLSPHKLPVTCTTPPPRSHVGRVLLHSVEITTPRSFPKLAFIASPAPSTRQPPAKTPTTTTGVAYHVAEAAASPSRPSALQNVLPPQTSPNRTNQLSSTPSRDRLQSKSPKKVQPPASRPQSPTRIPRNLPSHLGTCLSLQKRAMLLELRNCIMECDEDASLGPTNTAASRQLKDLLAGTVTRGEGNSCFVLGPRGSGKTAVSWPYLPVV
jgi:origin recognition complex subunit 4